MRSLYEKLNRLDDSLIKSKRIVKNKKLTESVEDDFDYSDFIPEEMTQFFCINEEDNEDPNEYMPEKGYRGYKAVASLIACGDYAEDLRNCGYQYALLINDPADNFFVGYVAGDRIYKLTEEDIYDQIGIDYDDDIDEMLTETASFKSGDRYYGGLPSEPSMSEYGKAMDAARKNRNALLDKYDIKVDNDRSKGYTTYTGTINGHTFKYVEGHRDFSRWLSELVIDNKVVNPYESSIGKIRKMFETNAVSISDVVDLLLKDNFDNIVYKESLTEGDSAREKLMNTYPDDFGHWEPYNRNPVKTTKVPPKTLDQYARDPETEVVEFDPSSTYSFKETGARQKLLNAFPDLKIEAYEPLKEAIKDTDYVIVLTHPNMPQDKRYSYFGSNYRMTRDLNKAMTYPGEFSAKDEIKYALDATDGHWDPSYADRFSVMTIAQVKELLNTPKPEKVSRAVQHNPSAQEAAKPIAKEIHEVIKNHNVSLSSFLKLITEIIKSEDPSA